MPRDPAYKRAPIEIWDTILNLAIISPLLPHPDDDIVDSYLLFTKKCESQRIQRTVEGVRTRLRLVCRGWNASSRDKGVKMVIGPFELGEPHRNEQYGKFDCQCGHSCLQPMDGLLADPTTMDDSTSIAKKFENLAVFATNSPRFLIGSTEMVAPRLRALHYDCLSHLELTGLSLHDMVPVPGSVNLPQLFVLSLRFTCWRFFSILGPAPAPNTALIGWVLPSLRTLTVEGLIEQKLLPTVIDFLSRRWNTVTSLYVGLSSLVRAGYQPFEIGPTFWDSFPNLHTVGFSEGTLARNTSPPPVYNDLCLVIDFLWGPHDSNESSAGARRILDDWKPRTIVLLCSWEEILGMLRGEDRLRSMHTAIPPDTRRPSAILAAALARNTRLLDAHRVSLVHEDHEEILNLIQNWGATNESRLSMG